MIKMGYIYKITNLLNNKAYIGQTRRHYTERWQEHIRDKNKEPYCNWPLYRMLNKIEDKNIKWEVLEEVDNSLLNEREQYWIRFFNTKEEGYNCTTGGSNGTKYDYNEILEYWLNEGKKTYSITAKFFNTTPEYISKIIHSLGYETRTKEEINATCHDTTKKKVNQIDLTTGKVINTFNSITEAGEKTTGDSSIIGVVCSGKRCSSGGYGWQFVEDIGKPIYLKKDFIPIYLPEYNISFLNITKCAEWFIKNNLTRSKDIHTVGSSIRYALKHSKKYQNIKLEEKEGVVYTYYEL